MAYITFQMVLGTLQTVGLLVGIYYYVMTLQNTKRNQQMQLEARMTQMTTQLYSWLFQTESMVEYGEILNWDWEDYDDFERKYGSDNNVLAYAKRNRIWCIFSVLGSYLRQGLVEIDTIYQLNVMTLLQWYKWREIIEEQRRRYYTPSFMGDWEYLVKRLIEHGEEIGDPWTPPASLSKYIPDK
jgi:hypothetical protein